MTRSENAVRVRILAATGNAAFAEKIALALETEDYEIAEGDFDPKEVDAAIVIWSGASIGSPEMIKAAALPLACGALIPVSIGRVEPPPAFQHLAPVDLAGWSGDPHDGRWRGVLDEIDRAAYAARLPAGSPALEPPVSAAQSSRRSALGAGHLFVFASFVAAAALVLGGFFLLSGAAPGGKAAGVAAKDGSPAAPSTSAAIETAKTPVIALASPHPVDTAAAASEAARPETEKPAPDDAQSAASSDKIAALIADNVDMAPDEQADETEDAPPSAENETAPAAAGSTFSDCPNCPEMTVIPAGEFLFGSPPGEPARQSDEGPVMKVSIAAHFALAAHETTYDEWSACVADGVCSKDAGADPGWGRGKRPVVDVSWKDANDYAAWLSKKTGNAYRLPTEEEWEYAARAGAKTPFSFGAVVHADQANFDASHPYGGDPGESRHQTLPVGSFPKNPFGLYDMAGNVWEWTEDCWSSGHANAPPDGGAVGGACSAHVLKGGAWNTGGWRLRAAHRISKADNAREFDNGFRVARDMP